MPGRPSGAAKEKKADQGRGERACRRSAQRRGSGIRAWVAVATTGVPLSTGHDVTESAGVRKACDSCAVCCSQTAAVATILPVLSRRLGREHREVRVLRIAFDRPGSAEESHLDAPCVRRSDRARGRASAGSPAGLIRSWAPVRLRLVRSSSLQREPAPITILAQGSSYPGDRSLAGNGRTPAALAPTNDMPHGRPRVGGDRRLREVRGTGDKFLADGERKPSPWSRRKARSRSPWPWLRRSAGQRLRRAAPVDHRPPPVPADGRGRYQKP